MALDKPPLRRTLIEHKVTVLWVTWTLGLITFAVVRVFDDPSAITAQGVAALTAVIGLPGVFIALFKWIRPRFK